MGLDMYLNAKRFLSEYNEIERKLREQIQACLPPDSFPIRRIECEVAYWRKFNALHNWFVNNAQSGHDDCQEVYLDKDLLQELLEIVEKVLEDHSLAEDLLPPTSGFFFGSTEINDYYFDCLKYTHNQLKLALSDQYKDWDFYYKSSW